MTKTYDEAKKSLLDALPYLRQAIATANEEGFAKFAIISSHPNGAGSITMEFLVDEFISDLAVLVGAPEEVEIVAANTTQIIGVTGISLDDHR